MCLLFLFGTLCRPLGYSLGSRCLEVVGTRKNGWVRWSRGEGMPTQKAHEKSFPTPDLITWQPLHDVSRILTKND